MVDVTIIEVPFDGYGRLGHQARTPDAMEEAGLGAALTGHDVRTVKLDLPMPSSERGSETSLINEAAIIALVTELGGAVAATLAAGSVPVVVGGDCTTLLGITAGLHQHAGPSGLLVFDGHEDTMPLDVSEDGEAANAELGLLLGVTGRLLRGPLAGAIPRVGRDHLAVLGHRDAGWRRSFNVGSLDGLGVHSSPWVDVRTDPADAARQAVAHLRSGLPRWWLHIDVDVLDPEELAAQGLPDVEDEPGGLTWSQLRLATAAAVGSGGCVGLSIAVYDPDQDPDRTGAAALVELVTAIVDDIDERSHRHG